MIRSALLSLCLLVSFATQSLAQLAMNLRDIELRAFVEIVSETINRNFILDPRVRGTVTVYAPASISSDALYEIFLNVLELNKLTIVEGDEVDRIVPLALARELSGDGNIQIGGDGYETRVIELKNITVQEAVDVITPLLPQESVLSPLPAANMLVLSDSRQNHERISQIIARLDRFRDTSVETIRLRNGNASELLLTLQELNITPPGASLSADSRGEAIVVSGGEDFRQRIRTLVRQLDTPSRSIQTAVVKLNYADAEMLRSVVAGSFGLPTAEGEGGGGGQRGDVTVVADTQSNALVITAPADRMPSIIASVKSLDERPSQVLVEAVIFELSVQTLSDLSAQFGGLLNNALFGGAEFSIGGRPTLTSLVSAALDGTALSPGSGGIFGGASESGGDGLVGFVSALASSNTARLLSTPSVLTLNNTEAEIVVAQSVPFVTGSYSTVGDDAIPEQPFQTIERQDVGLTLRVTPQITGDNTVRMSIQQEVSNLTSSTSAAGGEITSKRTLNTNVLVRDGRVIMLGGLLENGSGSESQGVPGLRDLPVLGGLFRGRAVNRNQRVLLLLLRPRIVLNDHDAEKLTSELALDARRASDAIKPPLDDQFPNLPPHSFPFDGANLNQPFDAGFIDPYARTRTFPPLPSRLEFSQ